MATVTIAEWVAGADGYKSGWFVVLHHASSEHYCYRCVQTFKDIIELPEKPGVIAVDIPIGLLDAAEPGGRLCDREARRLLGRPRNSSVFSPPVRAALSCRTYPSALRANRSSSEANIGIAQQCYALFAKLREAQAVMELEPGLQTRVFEVHPELSFFEMAKNPMIHSKKSSEGRKERKALLKGFEPLIRAFDQARPSGVGWDDCLDACAACWTSSRIAIGRELPTSASEQRSRDLRMEIWR